MKSKFHLVQGCIWKTSQTIHIFWIRCVTIVAIIDAFVAAAPTETLPVLSTMSLWSIISYHATSRLKIGKMHNMQLNGKLLKNPHILHAFINLSRSFYNWTSIIFLTYLLPGNYPIEEL